MSNEHPSILLIEDSPVDVDLTLRAFGRQRLINPVVVARDGEEALAVARRFRPDAVMMDLRMPRMNGYRAFEAIRREETLRATRVIAVTASSLIDDQGLQAIAFDGYIRKPYAPTELLNVLLSLFGEAAVAAIEAAGGKVVVPAAAAKE